MSMFWHYTSRRGRPPKPRIISVRPPNIIFLPLSLEGVRVDVGPPLTLYPDEYEAYRLVYFLGLKQEDAAKRMNVSRGTLWRCLNSARKKLAYMLCMPKSLIILSRPYVRRVDLERV